MKKLYTTFFALAALATTAVAQSTTESKDFVINFAEQLEKYNFGVNKAGDNTSGLLAGKTLELDLLTVSAPEGSKTHMWQDAKGVIGIRVQKNQTVTLRAKSESTRFTKMVMTSNANVLITQQFNGASTGEWNAETGTWTGSANEITFTVATGTAIIAKIEGTYDVPTSISTATTRTTVFADNTPVYNLQGQKVATYATFLTLPKGIYIVNGQKVVR